MSERSRPSIMTVLSLWLSKMSQVWEPCVSSRLQFHVSSFHGLPSTLQILLVLSSIQVHGYFWVSKYRIVFGVWPRDLERCDTIPRATSLCRFAWLVAIAKRFS